MLLHRNINIEDIPEGQYFHTTIENIIDRGGRRDWALLYRAMLQDPVILQRVATVSEALRDHPFSKRFEFWNALCERIEENTMVRQPYCPEWEELLSAAAHTGHVVPEAVLVGGSACALHARHRFSYDADFVLRDLAVRFEFVLSDLEREAGWSTDRVVSGKIILGQMNGVDTCVRQLIRSQPLETGQVQLENGLSLTVPTLAECLRIKCALILKRNAFRDYLDVAGLVLTGGIVFAVQALDSMDTLYPQPNGASACQQLVLQLADPQPFDLNTVEPVHYKGVSRALNSWDKITDILADMSEHLLEQMHAIEPDTISDNIYTEPGL